MISKKLTYEYVQKKFEESGLELLEETYVNSQTKMRYRCKICGLEHSMRYNDLQQGEGCPHCMSSNGEKLILNFCKQHNINFKPQYSFDDLKYKIVLRFDFGIIYNTQLLFLIEFNGIQHYQPVEHFGGKPRFKLQQHLDSLKSTYCLSHGIPLHIIRYDEDTTERLNEIFQEYFGQRMISKFKQLLRA